MVPKAIIVKNSLVISKLVEVNNSYFYSLVEALISTVPCRIET